VARGRRLGVHRDIVVHMGEREWVGRGSVVLVRSRILERLRLAGRVDEFLLLLVVGARMGLVQARDHRGLFRGGAHRL